LPGAVEGQYRAAPAQAGTHNLIATGHATADRMTIGVISLTGGRTTQGTPESLGTCGPGP